MEKSYYIEFDSYYLNKRATVYRKRDNKIVGHLEETKDREPVWICALPDWVYLSLDGKTAEQAAYNLVAYVNKTNKYFATK